LNLTKKLTQMQDFIWLWRTICNSW